VKEEDKRKRQGLKPNFVRSGYGTSELVPCYEAYDPGFGEPGLHGQRQNQNYGDTASEGVDCTNRRNADWGGGVY
jgi:hypothetical protein